MVNNVLLVKIEGPVSYTIHHHLPVVKGVSSNPSINPPTNGQSHGIFGMLTTRSPANTEIYRDLYVIIWFHNQQKQHG